MENPVESLVLYSVFLFSTTVHEAAHALAALLGGDETAYEGGQVSLDPFPHIARAPWGMVVLPMISLMLIGWPFGYASTPYDPEWADRHPRRAAWMALAGPVANLLLTVLAGAIMVLCLTQNWLMVPERFGFLSLVDSDAGRTTHGLAMLLSGLFSMNLLLFALNLIPVPPLDGSSAVTLLFGEELTRRWNEFLRQPMIAMAGILVAWKLIGMIFGPLFFTAAGIVYSLSHAL